MLTLQDTIKKDCEYYNNLDNVKFRNDMLRVKHSHEDTWYYLYLNDKELWFGTLSEINAIIKTMIKLEKM